MVARKAAVWFVIVLVHGSVTILMPSLLLFADVEPPHSGSVGNVRLLGVIPGIIGVLIMFWSVVSLVIAGKGTPAPFDPPKALVIKGPYQFVRNPMYIGDLFVLLGEALFFESFVMLGYSLLMLSIWHLFVIGYEEPVLKRKFGESYERYCNSVPRWIPALRPYQ
jgi:protein-S-isoprenylcysteine O-methyltransferase Ste14